MTIIILSPEDIVREISRRARSLRLLGAMTQVELAARAGVTLASLRRFERTGEASFGLVAKIASALRVEGAFDALFQAPAAACLDEAMARSRPVRRRGRRKEGAA